MEDDVKVVPVGQVGQVVMLVKGNTPVGVELVWEGAVQQVADACTVLNMLKMANNDAAWIVRQTQRTVRSNDEEEETGQ